MFRSLSISSASTRDETTKKKKNSSQWLTYWVVYSLFSLAESALLLVSWVPLYFELKTVLLLWLVAPQTKGAELVYERAVAPFLKQHASKIDPIFSGAERAAFGGGGGGSGGQGASKTLNDLAKKFGPKAAAQALEKAAAEVAAGSKPLLDAVTSASSKPAPAAAPATVAAHQ